MTLILVQGVLKEIGHVKTLAQCLAQGNSSINFGYYIVILVAVCCAVGSTHKKGEMWCFGAQIF